MFAGPLRDVSSGSETDDERSLHNAVSHLSVNHHNDTNTETLDKETQCVTSDNDISGDTDTISITDVTASVMVIDDTVSVNQDNPTDDTDTVDVTGDNPVNERLLCDTHDYTLVGGGIQRCSPLVEMDSNPECCPLVDGDGKCELFGADVVTLRDSVATTQVRMVPWTATYQHLRHTQIWQLGNLLTFVLYQKMLFGQPADICIISKYGSWATY